MRVPGAVRFFTAARASHAVYGSIVVLAVTGCGIGLVELKKLTGH